MSELSSMPAEFHEHYGRMMDEDTRFQDYPMEALRTLELLDRYLPKSPACILDVGGGPGYYARRLAKAGYEVYLVDPVPRHIQLALLDTDDGPAPASATQGDARSLEQHSDGSIDAVLLLGPLYHLTEKSDRMAALSEAFRTLKPGGVILAAGLSRYASMIDGLDEFFVDDPAFVEIIYRDLAEGQHRNPTDNPCYFTTAYLHRPDDLRGELAEAGFVSAQVLAVEGVSWAARDLGERLANPQKRRVILDLIQRTESEPSILGASPHLMGIGYKPNDKAVPVHEEEHSDKDTTAGHRVPVSFGQRTDRDATNNDYTPERQEAEEKDSTGK